MLSPIEIREITKWEATDLHALAELLIAVVEDGASVGFLPPLRDDTSITYWEGVLAPDVRLWVATHHGEIAGTVQLHLSTKQNGLHRAEIAKLMVHPKARRLGIARKLMEIAEETAKREHCTLLVLDTREGDPSNVLYQNIGYIEAGRIPQYAKSANGRLDATVFYYKLL